MADGLDIVGVRHHSPACARVVRHVIETRRPRWVLIEGPADMNPRLGELTLPHRLPVAIFSYYSAPDRTWASWSPFCDYSPEWVALGAAAEVGAEARFFDLPAWSESFRGVRNRYADKVDRYSARIRALCHRFAVDDSDALWDHLFEQPDHPERVKERLDLYFESLRDDPTGQGHADVAREAHMARAVAWALAQGGGVVVVCGGWHAPALARLHEDADPSWPDAAAIAPEARVGSYLVPYSFRRLDSFVGYESGMPSPAWYQAVWSHGPERAPDLLLERAVTRLRDKEQLVSPADVVAVSTLATGLQRLRGHAALGRVDLLDAMAGALLKAALDTPLPWSRRGLLRAGTDPLVVELVDVFSGAEVGALAPGTPRPPLIHDVRAELEALDLAPSGAPRRLELRLDRPLELRKSRTLHRLRVLGIPGFTRTRGPAWATDGELGERWEVVEVFEAESALIEAAAYGATLGAAALARLEDQLAAGDGVAALADVLSEAVFVGIDGLTERVMDQVRSAVGAERDLGALGLATRRLLGLWRHDALLGGRRAPALGAVVEAAFDRALWLIEGVLGPEAPADPGRIGAVLGVRDVAVHGAGLALALDAATGVMTRRAHDQEAPPDLRGAALGYLWSTAADADPGAAEADAVIAVRRAASPAMMGDFLAGLFALARAEIPHAPALIGAIDQGLRDLGPRDFLVALPALRQAFEYFPPRERVALAELVLAHHGGGARLARDLVAPGGVEPAVIASGLALEARVDEAVERWGLGAAFATEEAS